MKDTDYEELRLIKNHQELGGWLATIVVFATMGGIVVMVANSGN